MRTSRGRVTIDPAQTDLRLRSLERNRAVLAFPGTGEASRIRTSNGNVRLRTLAPRVFGSYPKGGE